jgi:hypothetical protein
VFKSLGISRKIYFGFVVVIVFFMANSVVSFILINENQANITYVSSVTQPSLVAFSELQNLLLKSKTCINSWARIDIEDHPDKILLKKLIDEEYPVARKSVSQLIENWKNLAEKDSVKNYLAEFDHIIEDEKQIMQLLSNFDSYQDLFNKIEGESKTQTLNEKINLLQLKLNKVIKQEKLNAEIAQDEMINSLASVKNINIGINVLVILIASLVAFLISNAIIKPIDALKGSILKLSLGDLPHFDIEITKDEIGEMVEGTYKLVDSIKNRTDFAVEIGKGNYDKSFELLSDKDTMGIALIEMRNNLKRSAEEDKRRSWANEGLAKIGAILRNQYATSDDFYYEINRFVVKYVDSIQSALYVVSENLVDEPYMEIVACFAYDRRKFLKKKVFQGEGLVGQSWIEKEIINITEVPNDYVSITSGLGEANPSNILIIPLKANNIVYGIIEIASFDLFEPYKIAFLDKIAESIASAIGLEKINQQTKKLLEETQIQSEAVKAQEEEMRQNLEELYATQEELMRKNLMFEEKEAALTKTINELKQQLATA